MLSAYSNPRNVLFSAQLSCVQWLRLSPQARAQTTAAYLGQRGIHANAAALAPLVERTDRYCEQTAPAGAISWGPSSGTQARAGADNSADVAKVITALLQASGQAASKIVESLNSVEIAKVAAESQKSIAEIHARQGQTADPEEQASLRNQELALLTVQAQLQARSQNGGMDATAIALIGAAVLVVVGVAYALSQRQQQRRREHV
jgi:hypothetical protein